MNRYYYSKDGSDVQGPISQVDLQAMCSAGVLDDSTQICQEGADVWQAITTIKPQSTSSSLPQRTASRQEPWPKQPSPQVTLNRVPCPSCSEPILKDATVCPYCKQAIFSHDKGNNAVIAVVVTVVLFFVIYYALTAFAEGEASRKYEKFSTDAAHEMEKINKDAQEQTDKMMRDLQKQYP